MAGTMDLHCPTLLIELQYRLRDIFGHEFALVYVSMFIKACMGEQWWKRYTIEHDLDEVCIDVFALELICCIEQLIQSISRFATKPFAAIYNVRRDVEVQ